MEALENQEVSTLQDVDLDQSSWLPGIVFLDWLYGLGLALIFLEFQFLSTSNGIKYLLPEQGQGEACCYGLNVCILWKFTC